MSEEKAMQEVGPPKLGRSLTTFYIVIGVISALVVLGALVYEPLRLKYAIHKVRNTTYPGRPGTAFADKWLTVCLDAACRGNRQAMEVVISYPEVSPRPPAFGPTIALVAALAQPERFLEALDQRDDKEAIRVLEILADALYVRGLAMVPRIPGPPLVGIVRKMEGHLCSGGPEGRVAQASLEFIKRRFAKELAEAEKAKQKVGTYLVELRKDQIVFRGIDRPYVVADLPDDKYEDSSKIGRHNVSRFERCYAEARKALAELEPLVRKADAMTLLNSFRDYEEDDGEIDYYVARDGNAMIKEELGRRGEEARPAVEKHLNNHKEIFTGISGPGGNVGWICEELLEKLNKKTPPPPRR